jgi:hypothetical protein
LRDAVAFDQRLRPLGESDQPGDVRGAGGDYAAWRRFAERTSQL